MSAFPEPGTQWYMAGTDGSGHYMVVGEGERGRLGYREIKVDVYRVRFEPNDDDLELIEAIRKELPNWCPPQSPIGTDTFRFSILANGKSALRCAVDMGLKAMGSAGSMNPMCPEDIRRLVEEPFDAAFTPPKGPPADESGGFWIGKDATYKASSMFGTWKSKKAGGAFPMVPGSMSPMVSLDEDEGNGCEDEEEEETNSYDEDEPEEVELTKPSKFTFKIKEKPADYEKKLDQLIAEDVPLGIKMTLVDKTQIDLTSALLEIATGEAKKMGISWQKDCSCSGCKKVNSIAKVIYAEAKASVAKKKEEEKVLTEDELKLQAAASAAELAKTATDLAATLKAFGF